MKKLAELKRLYPIIKTSVLAKKYGFSESHIRTLAYRLGVKKQSRWTKKQQSFVLKHYKKDMTASEIGHAIGKTKHAVKNKYRELIGLLGYQQTNI